MQASENCDVRARRPLVSVLMATYNRAHTIKRAVESVLAQTYPFWELIIVDDGSTDATADELRTIGDPRVRVLTMQTNSGVCAARNAAFDVMTGDWFTFLDSDDEMLPTALDSLLAASERGDPPYRWVLCNCIDSSTGQLAGLGLDYDQTIDLPGVVRRCRGEHWGLIRTDILGKSRFNPQLPGWETVLWYSLGRDVTRYYLHSGLRIYHTEGADRISLRPALPDATELVRLYATVGTEESYLSALRAYAPDRYADVARMILVAQIASADRAAARRTLECSRMAWSKFHQLAASGTIAAGPQTAMMIVRVAIAAKRAKRAAAALRRTPSLSRATATRAC